MSEKWKQKILLILPFAVLAAGMILTLTFFFHTYRQIAFEHTSALCETILTNSPEAEPQLLAALKDYHALTEQELKGNGYLEKYGYRADDFCNGFPPGTVLFPIFFFLAAACAFAAGILLSRRKNQKRIAGLTSYLEQVNMDAGGTLIQTKEDEYSHLQDELYKTVTMLYQTRETAVAAKINFAENLANIAHQLKTPIAALSTCLTVLSEADSQEQKTEFLARSLLQVDKLRLLADALMNVSRLETGMISLQKERVNLSDLLVRAVNGIYDKSMKKNIAIETSDFKDLNLNLDPKWTAEAIMNVLDNALKYSPKNSKISIHVQPLYSFVRVEITDCGIGIEKSEQNKIFRRFYRGMAPEVKNSEGSGIGLYLTRRILEEQGGTISVKSEPGKGAAFILQLPL